MSDTCSTFHMTSYVSYCDLCVTVSLRASLKASKSRPHSRYKFMSSLVTANDKSGIRRAIYKTSIALSDLPS